MIRMGRVGIDILKDAVADFCRVNHIRRLALFGSVLREDFRPDSDVDVLVEFDSGVRVGLRFFEMELELPALVSALRGALAKREEH